MSDLVQDAKFLKYYFTSDDMLKDKDILKNEIYHKYSAKVGILFMVPMSL